MANEARRLRPDILLLQESFAAPTLGLDTAGHLSAALGMPATAAPAREKERQFEGGMVLCSSGLAVLSRGRVLDSRVVALPEDERDGQRISQIVSLAIGGVRVLVINVHLVYLPDRDDLRRVQIEMTLGALPSLASYDAVVLAGDFNCPPESDPIKWLIDESGFGAADACAVAGAGFTTHEQTSIRPAQRIDYIFLLETGGSGTARVLRAERVFDVPDPMAGVLPSDHCGVMAWLVVEG